MTKSCQAGSTLLAIVFTSLVPTHRRLALSLRSTCWHDVAVSCSPTAASKTPSRPRRCQDPSPSSPPRPFPIVAATKIHPYHGEDPSLPPGRVATASSPHRVIVVAACFAC
uniref:Uncharacterized protein n=1 Tax=Oryza nivara TaxID=4536 RepID=A0A0E0HRZ4_ORYNI